MIDLQPVKGTRDFYPADLQKRNYIFNTWRSVLPKHGFQEYETSLLENAELYIAKSGEELGGSQLYNFKDKGDRFIALRPEQTPSLARLVANKFGELKFPLRWFSVPNCFRYERPQKGRLREHWQLNVDIIGLEPGYAELELLSVLGYTFKAFGAGKEHFRVMYNHRDLLDTWLKNKRGFNLDQLIMVYKVLDDWFKVDEAQKKEDLKKFLNEEQVQSIFNLANKTGSEWGEYLAMSLEYPELKNIQNMISSVHPDLDYELNPCIIRGIAYYTGIVFEAFDKNPENNRALFGGGRYDNLMELFGKEAPAVGFGFGDVMLHEFLEGHGLYPDFSSETTTVGILPLSEDSLNHVFTEIIPDLVSQGLPYDINYEFERSENKRYQALKKRGCDKIIKW